MSMHIEYELKYFTSIDQTHVYLEKHATLIQPKTLFTRVYLQDKDGDTRWVRIRDEGQSVIVTFKTNNGQKKIDSICETQMQVTDFQEAQNFFLDLGFMQRLYMQTYRETWQYEDAIITFDTWPGIPPFIEIEGKSAQHVYYIAEKLGYTSKDGHTISIKELYCKTWNIVPDQFQTITSLTFENVEAIKQEFGA